MRILITLILSIIYFSSIGQLTMNGMGRIMPSGNQNNRNYGLAWNPLKKGTHVVLSDLNRHALQGGSGTASCVLSTIGVADSSLHDSVYCELVALSGIAGFEFIFGIADSAVNLNSFCGSDIHGYGYNGNNGLKYNNGTPSSYGSTWVIGDTIAIALNMTSKKVWFGKIHLGVTTWQASGDPVSGANPAFSGFSGTIYICGGTGTTPDSNWYGIFKSGFSGSIPSGYVALSNH